MLSLLHLLHPKVRATTLSKEILSDKSIVRNAHRLLYAESLALV